MVHVTSHKAYMNCLLTEHNNQYHMIFSMELYSRRGQFNIPKGQCSEHFSFSVSSLYLTVSIPKDHYFDFFFIPKVIIPTFCFCFCFCFLFCFVLFLFVFVFFIPKVNISKVQYSKRFYPEGSLHRNLEY